MSDRIIRVWGNVDGTVFSFQKENGKWVCTVPPDLSDGKYECTIYAENVSGSVKSKSCVLYMCSGVCHIAFEKASHTVSFTESKAVYIRAEKQKLEIIFSEECKHYE